MRVCTFRDESSKVHATHNEKGQKSTGCRSMQKTSVYIKVGVQLKKKKRKQNGVKEESKVAKTDNFMTD